LNPLEDSFFGFQEVMEELIPSLQQLTDIVLNRLHVAGGPEQGQGEGLSPEALSRIHIVLFGELFGGWYPLDPPRWQGPVASGRLTEDGKVLRWDAPNRTASKGKGKQPPIHSGPTGQTTPSPSPSDIPLCAGNPVQEGVYYSPSKEFAVFDIAIVWYQRREGAYVQHVTYLPFSATVELTDRAGLLHVPVIGNGPWSVVDDLPVTFDSMVPVAVQKHYDLKLRTGVMNKLTTKGRETLLPLPLGSNIAEGFVLRPESSESSVLYKGQGARPLLKKKHSKFSEVEGIETVPEDALDSGLTTLKRYLKQLCNRNRVAAVMSKVGDGPQTQTSTSTDQAEAQIQVLAQLLMDDVWEDFWASAPPRAHQLYSTLTADDLTECELWLNLLCTELIRV
jgi:hypothetical protein